MARTASIQVGQIISTNKSGDCEVIHYWNAQQILVRFVNTGTVVTARATDLRNGQVKDCMAPCVEGVGYLGVGEHKANVNGKRTREYSTWTSMIQRGYSKVLKSKYPTYEDCVVDERWHNFQTFCDDIKTLEGYEMWLKTPYAALDKDIKIPGNKVYSKDTCMFVTVSENARDARNRNKKD